MLETTIAGYAINTCGVIDRRKEKLLSIILLSVVGGIAFNGLINE